MKKLLLLLAFGLWTVDCGLSQTPFTLSVRDATSSPYNLTAVFTPQTIYGYTFSNAIYGAGITNAASFEEFVGEIRTDARSQVLVIVKEAKTAPDQREYEHKEKKQQ